MGCGGSKVAVENANQQKKKRNQNETKDMTNHNQARPKNNENNNSEIKSNEIPPDVMNQPATAEDGIRDNNGVNPETGFTPDEEANQFKNKIIIFLIGGPGSGKGTQSERIIKDFDAGYMSAGDLLRKEADKGSELGNFIQEQMKQGAIVPQEITLRLLKNEILSQDKQLYLIDGFPRKVDKAEAFEKEIIPCKCALFLDVPDDVLVERLLGRAETSGRADDNPDTIKKRIITFHEVSEAVFNHFDKFGKSVKIDGNRNPDEVYADVKTLIQKIVNENK
ncbi:Adenylate kinase family protein [Tritrichomonas foetus]|uniref:Adenylate kinase family protein n=1 Tax=Tritrichomonas foetus TaxID=1144522 RepID=A0A1J4KUZ1_9EUKA|nr:Adenylate kinase family protein [Tritrichomonas foetus]|eukprot:OHT15121.1 Adenylate kinase family protein [Tritrichomonas foetus]